MPVVDSKRKKYRKPIRANINKSIVKYIAIGLAACALIAGLIVLAILVFKSDNTDEPIVYFSSDLLSEDGGEYQAFGSIEFSLYNYADSLRVSYVDIENVNVEVFFGGKDITKSCDISLSSTSFEKSVSSESTVTIAVDEKYYNKQLTVYANTTPVSKSIFATFTVQPTWYYTFEDEQNSIYSSLSLYANQTVTLKITKNTDELLFDNSNPFYISTHQDNSFFVTIEPGQYETIYFFKVDPTKSYSIDGKKPPIEIELLDEIIEIDFSTKSDENVDKTSQETEAK